MRSPSLIYALTNDEGRAALNRAKAARQATRTVARSERGSAPCRP